MISTTLKNKYTFYRTCILIGNGVTAVTHYISQRDAFTYCHERTSFLPGPSQFPCTSMTKSDQGYLPNYVWSAIFRVLQNDTGVHYHLLKSACFTETHAN